MRIRAYLFSHSRVQSSFSSFFNRYAISTPGRTGSLLWVLLCGFAASLIAQTPTAVPVPTWRYDLTHAGQNTSETMLTPSNVNVNSFGKLFSLSVDSTVYAQPLYIPGLTMSDGQVHNVVFVATENDSIYAFDADSNGGADANPIWQISMLTAAHGAGAGAVPAPWADTGSPDVAPTVGITGTPVINPVTNTMYVVAETKENGQYYSRLHAINVINGNELPGSPVNIPPTTSDRMSKTTHSLLKAHDVRVIIGKGGMKGIASALKDRCVYLAYTGGCAALASKLIQEVKTVHWLNLGMPEAVWVLRVKEFGP